MSVFFDETDSLWKAEEAPGWNRNYREHLLEALNAFGPLFKAAKTKSEFEFIIALLRVRGLADAGWDAWENTVQAVEEMQRLHAKANYEAAAHLSLWLYGHIVEASEPYEMLANMLNIASGDRWHSINFPDRTRQNGSTIALSPSEKIQQLTAKAAAAQLPPAMAPLQGLIDRNLRNAIFHSDYSVYEGKVRIFKPMRDYTREEALDRANLALAYFEAIKYLVKLSCAEYTEPRTIPVHPGFSADPDERAIVIVRQDEGAVGLKDAWTPEQLRQGKITFRIGRIKRYEERMLDADHLRASLPRDRTTMVNKALKLMPSFLRTRLMPLARRSIDSARWPSWL